jgi:asparagine synthase (glutamine-hydrolysing)
MSVQFGKWNFDGKPSDPQRLAAVEGVLAPYGPDRATFYSKGGVDVLYHAFHTTKESGLEIQPHVLESGAVLTWDGRLDNRSELMRLLDDSVSGDSTDLAIVARSYERWGTRSFGRLIGDWALSVWNPRERALILAEDPIGTRHLYYTRDSSEIMWSTILDPLVLFSRKSFELEEEYVAGWLANFPAPHLTPYGGIYAVPPSSFVRVDAQQIRVVRYWDFDPSRQIRCQKDTDYEEQFRNVFKTAVQRRLRSNAPVLAELSGGMDSSSIVCMADLVIGQGNSETPRLDTLSYYDDSEPSWNERPYFTIVENKRGQKGGHIDLASDGSLRFATKTDRFLATPGARGRSATVSKQLAAAMGSRGTRVVLSGIGGDEFTGGLPTPVPELADLVARAHYRRLARQLNRWALEKKQPWIHVLSETLKRFLPAALVGVAEFSRPAPWLRPGFVERQQAALTGYERRLSLFGPLPSFQEFQSTLEAVRRQLGCATLSPASLSEKRYPYLDRELLEFLCAIPREQLLRPGERRSLIRRALVGIVPDELLNRKRKAFVARSPRLAIAAEWDSLVEISRNMISASLGVVDSSVFRLALERARSGERMSIVPVLRTIEIESWLRNVHARKTLDVRPHDTTAAQSAVGDGAGTSLPVPRRLGSQLRRADR